MKKRYLQRPKSTYTGIVLIILGLLPDFNVNIILVFILFAITVIVSYHMAEKTDTVKLGLAQDGEKKASDGNKI
ncbi:MAG: hypothetical protein WCO05_01305 [Candidatus Moraniibacteriota bacterium]|jgi:hypothetical protein